ncbi:hypothetical protein MK489_09575 [Myxococcota bacterium]|nr:hypothetical protein [Myxococcota bacterium]
MSAKNTPRDFIVGDEEEIADHIGEVFGAALQRFTIELEDLGIGYCVVRNFAELPDRVRGDVDLLIEPDRLDEAEAALSSLGSDTFVARRIERDGHLLIWVGSRTEVRKAIEEEREAVWLELDLVTSLSWHGISYLDTTDVLSRSRRHRGFWVTSPADEACHVLCHGLLDKPRVSARYQQLLRNAYGRYGASFLRPLLPSLGARALSELTLAVRSGTYPERLSRLVRRRLSLRGPRSTSSMLMYQYRRAGRRLTTAIHPPGPLIATAGPDGSGKSTLLAALGTLLGGLYRPTRSQYMGWKEFVLPTKRILASLRSGQKPSRSTVVFDHHPTMEPEATVGWAHNFSVIHYFIDLWARYLLAIRPVMLRGGLVLCDRYFFDVLIQEVLLCENRASRRLLLAATPGPDVTALFVGDAVTIAARKGELTPERTERQLQALAILTGKRGVVCIDAHKPVSDNLETILHQLLPAWSEGA